MTTQAQTPKDQLKQRNIHLKILTLTQKISLVLSLFLPSFLTCCDQSPPKDHLIIGISQIVEHPALDEARKGIEDTLKKQLKGKKYEILYKNAQGNITTAKQIAQNLAVAQADVLVGISTPSAQTLKSTLKGRDVPLVFTCVTDPVQAGLVKNVKNPPRGITGVTDTPLLEKQIDLMKKIMPGLKTLGLMYNPGEPNSVTTIERMRVLCAEAGIEIVEGTVSKTADVSSTAHYLMPKVQAVYVPQDNILVAAMQTLTAVGYEVGVPVFVSDTGSIKKGALATISYSYYDVGVETGKKVVQILEGASAESLEIGPPGEAKVYINKKAAKRLGIKIPKG